MDKRSLKGFNINSRRLKSKIDYKPKGLEYTNFVVGTYLQIVLGNCVEFS
jgi:hypothetical protein